MHKVPWQCPALNISHDSLYCGIYIRYEYIEGRRRVLNLKTLNYNQVYFLSEFFYEINSLAKNCLLWIWKAETRILWRIEVQCSGRSICGHTPSPSNITNLLLPDLDIGAPNKRWTNKVMMYETNQDAPLTTKNYKQYMLQNSSITNSIVDY